MSSSAPAPPSSSTASAASPGGGGPRPFRSRFGDTTLTKVFVGGLAWETPSEGLRQHFERYGDILEAVVITDRLTGRSKGYGFVTFREPEAARRAVQDPNPTIAGRRANCNIASLGPPRPAQPREQGLAGAPPAATGHGPAVRPQAAGAAADDDAPACDAHLPFAVRLYWYPPDFQYQQAMVNPQLLQSYYAQLYGLASPGATPPYHHQPYVGYMPPPAPSPRAPLLPPPPPPPAQQIAAQPLVHHPTAPQIQGAFAPVPSLPHSFRLQLPPHASSMLPPNAAAPGVPILALTDVLATENVAEFHPAEQAASTAGVTNTNSTPGA
ncbi:hypothetical protein ACP4OV_017494 [Aristida adscensionis]